MATATKKTLKPLNDKVIIQKLEAEDKTSGGILLPDSTKEKPQEGKIVAVGPGATDEKGNKKAIDLKEGDLVLYAKYSGTEVKIDGVEYLIISEKDVLAVIQ